MEFRNSGTILLSGNYPEAKLHYEGISCNSYIEYWGFRESKKFKTMLKNIKKDLEEICKVRTGKNKQF